MGRKRSWPGQFIFLCIAGLISFPLFSCTNFERQLVITREVFIEKIPKQVTKKEERPKPEEHPKPEEYLKPEVENLGRAEQLFKQGDYEGSLKENQRVLSISGKNPPGDKAIFNMGLIYAYWENPKKDYDKSLLFFKKILADYPQSPLVEEAKTWVGVLQQWSGMLQENEKLKKVIQKLKEVDIEVDGKKREKER